MLIWTRSLHDPFFVSPSFNCSVMASSSTLTLVTCTMSPARAAGPSLRTASSQVFLSQVPFSAKGKALRDRGSIILAVAYSEDSPRISSTRWSRLSFLVSPCKLATARKAARIRGGMREADISLLPRLRLHHLRARNQLLQSEKNRHHD